MRESRTTRKIKEVKGECTSGDKQSRLGFYCAAVKKKRLHNQNVSNKIFVRGKHKTIQQ